MSKRLRVENASAGKNYDCPRCPFTTVHKNSFKYHCLRHLNVMYPCSQCNFKSTHKQGLKKHSLVHQAERAIFVCGICDIHFPSQYVLHIHDGKHHRQLFSCDYCDYKSKFRNNLTIHIRTHTGDYIECEDCDKKFASQSGLKSHVINIHSEEPKCYNCPKCSYSTNDKKSILQHDTTHTGKKLFSCPDCSYTTNLKTRLSEHVVSHTTSDPPFKCEICDYSNFFSRNLREHQKEIHFKIKVKVLKNIIKCSVCFTVFKDQELLDEHVMKKHGEGSQSMKEILAPFIQKSKRARPQEVMNNKTAVTKNHKSDITSAYA